MMGCVHFINAQWSIASSIASSLLSHPVGHEEGLIWLLGTKPKYRNKINSLDIK